MKSSNRIVNICLAVVILSVSIAPGIEPVNALPESGTIELVSVASDGTQSNDYSYFYSISADGRYVAFNSAASNLVIGDTNEVEDIFVHDRVSKETTRVSVASDGTQGNKQARGLPSISADGRYVAFLSTATNLIDEGTLGELHVYVHDRESGETTIVSISSEGIQGNNSSGDANISADGRYVAFSSHATNLVNGYTGYGFQQVYLHDRESGETTAISVSNDSVMGNYNSWATSISADGRYVAFYSAATNLVSFDTNNTSQVYVYDQVNNALTVASIANDGTVGNGYSKVGILSANGRYVSFTSMGTNLVVGDTNGYYDVFVHDRETGITTIESIGVDEIQGNYDSGYSSSVSSDGKYLAFASDANNLVIGDLNGYRDVFVRDRDTGEITMVSVANDGTQGDSTSAEIPIISASVDGLTVAFSSNATNLIYGDINDTVDVFVHDREGIAPEVYSISGRITDSTGNPLPDVTVSSSAGHVSFTNEEGYYSLVNVLPGTYTFIASKYHYVFEPAMRTVTVPPSAVAQDFVGEDVSYGLEIMHIEVTQAIQDAENSVPLIAGKETMARVFVRSLDEDAYVSGTMRAYDAVTGVQIGSSIISDNKVVANYVEWSDALLSDFNVTFNNVLRFMLPESWTTNLNDIRIEVDLLGVRSFTTLSFFSVSPISIVYIPVEYQDDLPDMNLDYMLHMMKSMYPVADINLEPGAPIEWTFPWYSSYCEIYSFDPDRESSCRGGFILKTLTDMYEERYEEYDFIIGLLPSAMVSEMTFGGLADDIGTGVAALVFERGIAGPNTLAHEIGHLLNQRHPNSDACNICSSEDCFAPDDLTHWPYPDCSIQDTGYDVPMEEIKFPNNYDDLMSYCDQTWVSKFTYSDDEYGILTEWVKRNTVSQIYSQNEENNYYIVGGMIVVDGPAFMDPIWIKDTMPSWENPIPGTEYCLQLQDVNSVVLNEICFDADSFSHETSDPALIEAFLAYLPIHASASRMVLKTGDTELASREVSTNTPFVTIEYPNGGESWSAAEHQVITWNGSDLDGDTLYYNVYYSDDGLNWSPLAVDLENTSLQIDTANLPGSNTAKIRVAVSDGFNTSEDESDLPFTILGKAPESHITTPENGSGHLYGGQITLSGYGFDLEDGTLPAGQVCWSSDRDGYLGCGDTVSSILSLGAHIITLSVEDSLGNVGTSQIAISVVACYFLIADSFPADGGTILVETEPNCSAHPNMYAAGTQVTLTAVANPGYLFYAWSEDASDIAATITTSMWSDQIIYANFNAYINIFLPIVKK